MPSPLPGGFFITLEGLDGSGKTTQAQLLAARLRADGWPVTLTYEPGGTELADRIRALLSSSDLRWLPWSQLHLILAARYDHVERVIRPALAAGQIVLCDRFTDSTLAYQGYGHGLDLVEIEQAHLTVVRDCFPDLTLLYDLDPHLALQRVAARHHLTLEPLPDGRFVSARPAFVPPDPGLDPFPVPDLSFYQRVRTGYLELVQAAPHRFYLLDASQDTHTLAHQTWHIVRRKLAGLSHSPED